METLESKGQFWPNLPVLQLGIAISGLILVCSPARCLPFARLVVRASRQLGITDNAGPCNCSLRQTWQALAPDPKSSYLRAAD